MGDHLAGLIRLLMCASSCLAIAAFCPNAMAQHTENAVVAEAGYVFIDPSADAVPEKTMIVVEGKNLRNVRADCTHLSLLQAWTKETAGLLTITCDLSPYRDLVWLQLDSVGPKLDITGLEHLSKLQTLLVDLDAIADNARTSLRRLSKLKALSIRSSRQHSASVYELIANNKDIVDLVVYGDIDFCRLESRKLAFPAQLTHFALRGCSVDAFTLKCLKPGSMRELLFDNVSGVTDQCLAHVGTLQSLRVLQLRRSVGTQSVGWVSMLSKLEALDKLDLGFTNIADSDLEHLRAVRPTVLVLDCTKVSLKGLADSQLMSRCVRLNISHVAVRRAGEVASLAGCALLRVVQADGLKCDELSSVGELAGLTQIEHLSIARVKGVDDALCGELAAIRGLLSLNIAHSSVTIAGIESLLKDGTPIRFLTVVGCQGIVGQEALARFEKRGIKVVA